MKTKIDDKRLLGSRFISSAISWEDLLKKANSTLQFFPNDPIYMGAAVCCAELTIIELSLKAIMATEGLNEEQLKNGSMGHKLTPIYEIIPELIKTEIEKSCGYSREKILFELNGIDKNSNGLVNWRYLDFIDSLDAPSTKQHFCDTFVKEFSFSCCNVAKRKCGVKLNNITKIANSI